jgi:hypothetical protein
VTDPHQMPLPTGGPPAPPRRHVVVSVIMVIFGIVLLLPGLCALAFAASLGSGGGALIPLLWLVCFAISAGGIALIVKAFR